MTEFARTIQLKSLYYGNNFGKGARVVATTMSNAKERDDWYKILPDTYFLGSDESPWAGWVNAAPGEKGVGIFRIGDINIIAFLYKTETGDLRDGGGYLYHWVMIDYDDMLALGGNWLGILDKIRNEHNLFVRQFNPTELVQLAPIQISPAQLYPLKNQLTQYTIAEAILATCFNDENVSISIENISSLEERAHTAQQIINLLPIALRSILPFTLSHVAYGNPRTYLDFDTPNRARYQVNWANGKHNLPKPSHIVATALIQALKDGRLEAFHHQWDERLALWMKQEKSKWRSVIQIWANWLHLETAWNIQAVSEATVTTLFELLQSDMTITPQTRYMWVTQSIDKLLAHPKPILRDRFANAICQNIQQLDNEQVAMLHDYLSQIFPQHGDPLIRWLLQWKAIFGKRWDSRWDDLIRQFAFSHTNTLFQQSVLIDNEEWLIFVESQLGTLITQDDWHHILEIGIQAQHPPSGALLMRYLIKKLDIDRIEDVVKQNPKWVEQLPSEYALLISAQAGFPDDRVIKTLHSFNEGEIEKIIGFQLKNPTTLFTHPKFVDLLVKQALMSKSNQTVYYDGLMWIHNAVKSGENFDERIFFHLLRYFMLQNNRDDAQMYYNLLSDTQFETFLEYLTPSLTHNPQMAETLAILTHQAKMPSRQFQILVKQQKMEQPRSPYAVGHIMMSLNSPDISNELSQNQFRREYIRIAFDPASRITASVQTGLFQWMTNQAHGYWMQHDISNSAPWLALCCRFGQGREQSLHEFFAKNIIAQSTVEDLSAFLHWGRGMESKPDVFKAIEPLFHLAKNSLQQVRTRELGEKILHKDYLINPLLNGLFELEKAIVHMDAVYEQMEKDEINLQQLFEELHRQNPNKYTLEQFSDFFKRLEKLRIGMDYLVKDFERDDIPKLVMVKRKSTEQVIDELLRGENKNPPKSRLAIWLGIIRAWIKPS